MNLHELQELAETWATIQDYPGGVRQTVDYIAANLAVLQLTHSEGERIGGRLYPELKREAEEAIVAITMLLALYCQRRKFDLDHLMADVAHGVEILRLLPKELVDEIRNTPADDEVAEEEVK